MRWPCVKEWIEAFDDVEELTHFDALVKRFSGTGILQDQVNSYIKALEAFGPETNCGKWYKAAYVAMLRAGSKCDKSYCKPINDIQDGAANTHASNCYHDLLFQGSASVALNFENFANALAKIVCKAAADVKELQKEKEM